jgi:Ca2+-binding RTX toxin-like protein
LIGPDAGATWDITGTNSGSVNGSTFSSFENFTGGSGNDQFVFKGGSVSGNINGGGGTNTLDYSNLSIPISINIQNDTATEIGGTFSNITNFIGDAETTLTGLNANTVWTFTALNTFTFDGFSFSGIPNVAGGSGDDRFVFDTGGGVSGTIDGGGGTNTMDYTPYVGDITVNLTLGTATGVGQGIRNIENLMGSIGDSMLVGNALANTLIGGTGRNVIIGGGGADTIVGGGGDNILLGGTTAYDSNATALAAIFAEWTRTDLSFEQRVADLNSNAPPSRALNGPYELNMKTVFDDGSADTLTGGGGLDWFFYDNKLDTLNNVKPADHKTQL